MDKSRLWPHLKRLGIITIISTIFALAFNELTFQMQKGPNERPPDTITFVIPSGTAQRVAAGDSVTLFPDDYSFVVGDVLEVKNEDGSPHQLGPIWVPPGATGRMVMEKADRYSYTCSFQSNKYLGLTVLPPTDLGVRFTALLLTAPTVAILLYLYSLAAFPLDGRKDQVLVPDHTGREDQAPAG